MRLVIALVTALVTTAATAAQAQSVEPLIGRLVTDVAVETTEGTSVGPGVLELIETRLGEPLSLEAVRDTIDHLVGLGRYDDVRAMATRVADGVELRWVVRPIRLVTRVTVAGGGDLPGSAVRAVIDERFGGEMAASRAPELAAAVAAFYRDHGYRAVEVSPLLDPGTAQGTATLTLQVNPGPRTTITSSTISGTPTEPAAKIVERLQIQAGRVYDRVELLERLLAYESDLRGQGYYAAAVRESTTFADDTHTAQVEVAIDAGLKVRLVYAGDPVPGGSLESLVPVREERSVDEDLLEDASRNIEAYLRERGYRAAQAPYSRSERNGELVLTFTVARGPLHHVNTVAVAGNTTLPGAEIEPLLKLNKGEPFADGQVSAITTAIEELYRVRGYERVAVKPAIEVLPEAGDGVRFRPVDVRFTIVEGPQTTVDAVTIQGAESVPEGELRGVLGLQAGRPFYRPLLGADRDALSRTYRNQGYLGVTIAPAVSLADENRRASVAWTIREGEQSRVDRVLITGNSRTNADIIRREMRIGPGDPLGAEAIAESQQRISQLGLFRRVRIADLPRTGSPLRDILVTVEEAPATGVTYGGGIEVGRRLRDSPDGGPAEERIEVAPRGFFEISRRNLWGKNRTLSFFSRVSLRPRDPEIDNTDPTDTGGYGFNDYRVTGTFREPRAFGRPGDAQFTAFLERGIRASFSFDRRGVRADYARRFAAGLTATVRYTNDYTELFDEQIAPEDRLLIDRLFPQVRLSTFSGGLLRDSRDDVLDPQRGTVLGFDTSVAARAYGSEVGFGKAFVQGFVYRHLPGSRFVVVGGARLGLARGYPRDLPRVDENGQPVLDENGEPIVDVLEEVPASERFFAGGDSTVRGFSLDRLGTIETLDPQGYPQGGNGLLVLNAELRAPYWKGVGLVGFVDAGNVFPLASEIEFGEVRVATGFGVRYRSPIGPLRVDLGFKVNPRLLPDGSRERGSIFHISLGQAF
jgi:outer membrane protein insertion porin family